MRAGGGGGVGWGWGWGVGGGGQRRGERGGVHLCKATIALICGAAPATSEDVRDLVSLAGKTSDGRTALPFLLLGEEDAGLADGFRTANAVNGVFRPERRCADAKRDARPGMRGSETIKRQK